MQQTLGKYKLGLMVIGGFSLLLALVVIVQAGTARQDVDTYTKASQIATTLNDYIIAKSAIPDSLAAAGVSVVPTNVTYSKVSAASYKFCINYQTSSSGFSPAAIQSDLITGTVSEDTNASSHSGSTPAALYLTTTHRKGEQCQTVKPYLYSATGTPNNPLNGASSTSSSDPAATCKYDPAQGSAGSQAYLDCLNKAAQ